MQSQQVVWLGMRIYNNKMKIFQHLIFLIEVLIYTYNLLI